MAIETHCIFNALFEGTFQVRTLGWEDLGGQFQDIFWGQVALVE